MYAMLEHARLPLTFGGRRPLLPLTFSTARSPVFCLPGRHLMRCFTMLSQISPTFVFLVPAALLTFLLSFR
jgi:hypothetical protein